MKNGDGRTEEIKEHYRKGLALENGLTSEAMAKEVSYRVEEAVVCIHEYLFNQRLTVSWMKEQRHLNGKNFSGKFKYYVGKTPKKYWLYHRIETAKLMLKDEKLVETLISAIAYSLGSNRPQTFSMAFKKYTGCSPKAFRDGDIGPSESEKREN